MEAPKAVSDHEEEPASRIWDWGMAEHLEDTADSEAGRMGKKTRRNQEFQEGWRNNQTISL